MYYQLIHECTQQQQQKKAFSEGILYQKTGNVSKCSITFPNMASQGKQKMTKQLSASLQILEKELDRSRVAVENIAQCAVTEGKYKQSVGEIQSELLDCITKLNDEHSKKSALLELIGLLKGEMYEYQRKSKKEHEASIVRQDKEIKLCQAEIDKILQKHNLEIAKISKLKDLANSRRSQRVVCSDLFKKLEKQIKYYEEVYKQQLMSSELSRHRIKKYIPRAEKINSLARESSGCLQKKRDIEDVLIKNYEYKQEDSHHNSLLLHQPNTLDLSLQAHKRKNKDPKFYTIRQQKEKQKDPNRKTGFKEQKFEHTKTLLKKIADLSNFVNNMKTKVGKESISKVVKYYSTLERENIELLESINNIDEKIRDAEKGAKQVARSTIFEQCAEVKKNNEGFDYGELLGHQLKSFKTIQQQEEYGQLMRSFEEISSVLMVDLGKNSQNMPTEDSILEIDRVTTEIREHFSIQNERTHREQFMFSETIVACLLEKMQRYTDCEKIFDKKVMKEEYYRELGKKRQIRLRKHQSRQAI